jgi:hypothetical protein
MTIFAYPVLCPPSDLPIDVNLDPAFNAEKYGYLDLDITLAALGRGVVAKVKFNNHAIMSLIDNGDAAITLVLESVASLVRRAIPIEDVKVGIDGFEVPFNLDDIGVPLPCDVTLFVVSKKQISNYALPGAPSKMGVNTGLVLPAGSVLGYSLTIPLLPRPIKADSIILVEKLEGLASVDSPRLEYSGESIRVLLAPSEYARFDALKLNPSSGRIVLYSVIMPALIQAVEMVRSGKDTSDLQDRNWYMSIKSVIQNPPPQMKLSDGQSSYEVAHRIMQQYVSLQFAFMPLFETSNPE